MAIADEVNTQLKAAMKAKEQTRLAALRSMRAAFLNEMKKDGSETLPDETAVPIMRKLAKQRKESIEAFQKAGRDEQAAAEQTELEVIESFLPSLADEATTRGWVEAAIAESGASTPGDVGRVMGLVMKSHKGEVDGGRAKQIAAELLGG
jgi:uncharacterized protein YqeY